MNEYVPHFAVLIFILFGIGFFFSLQGVRKLDEEDKKEKNPELK